MTIKMIGCSAKDCGVGFVFGKNAKAELIETHAENCKIGFLQTGSEQEFALLLANITNRTEDLEVLVQDYDSSQASTRSEKIFKSRIFEHLSSFADAATVYQFLEGIIKQILK